MRMPQLPKTTPEKSNAGVTTVGVGLAWANRTTGTNAVAAPASSRDRRDRRKRTIIVVGVESSVTRFRYVMRNDALSLRQLYPDSFTVV